MNMDTTVLQETFEGLTIFLQRNLKMQKETPERVICTMCSPDYCNLIPNMGVMDECGILEHEELNGKDCSLLNSCGLRVKISNFELDLFDGSNPFTTQLDDKEPKLQMRLVFWNNEKGLEVFKSLPCASCFIEVVHETTKEEKLFQYFVDCGQNVNKMAEVYTQVLTHVYGVKLEDVNLENFHTEAFSTYMGEKVINDKKSLRQTLQKQGIPFYKIPMLNNKMHIHSDVIDEMQKMVDNYNTNFSNKTNTKFVLNVEQKTLFRIALLIDPNKKIRTNIFSVMKKGYDYLKAQEYEGNMYDLGAICWK